MTDELKNDELIEKNKIETKENEIYQSNEISWLVNLLYDSNKIDFAKNGIDYINTKYKDNKFTQIVLSKVLKNITEITIWTDRKEKDYRILVKSFLKYPSFDISNINKETAKKIFLHLIKSADNFYEFMDGIKLKIDNWKKFNQKLRERPLL